MNRSALPNRRCTRVVHCVGVAVCLFSIILCARSPAGEGQPVAETEAPPPEGIVLNFQDAPLALVLSQLSEASGLVVLPMVDVTGRVSIISQQPLSVADAVALLNTVLLERGYAGVQIGRTLKIIPLDEAKKANILVRSGSDPADIEPGDAVMTQVIPLRSVDAVKLKEDIAALIPSYAQLSANASSNSLILTDTSSNIRRIVEIVHALEAHMSAVAEVKVFQLNYANATDAARLISEIFKQEEPTGQGGFGGASRFFRPDGGRNASATEQAGLAPKVTTAADQRTNTVVVSAPPDLMKIIEGVMKDLDANPAAQQAVFVYPLRNARAKNLATVLNELFGKATQDSGAAAGRAPQGEESQEGGRGGFFGTLLQGASTAAETTGAELYGQVYVVADEDTNSLLIMTSSKNFEKAKGLLAKLDRPIPQVLIKVLIAEVTHSDENDLGTEFSILNLGGTLHSETGTGPVYGFDGTLSATLRAWQEEGKLEVLSRPYILASDNQLATITIGQEAPFIRQTRTTETGQTISTIEYEDIGIILKVTPHVNPDGLVIMDIYPEISATTGATEPISETLVAPVFGKRSAKSRVAVQDGQTIVIGGLMENKKTQNVRKVPLLGSIPVLGALFRHTVTSSAKTELLIFLTPHVAQQPAALQRISEAEKAGSQMIPDAVEPGTFDEHMEGLQRGGSSADEE